MYKLNQRGVIQFFVLLILIAGLIAAVYLVQKTQIFKPKASVSAPITPITSFALFTQKNTYNVGEVVAVSLFVHSDNTAANLFNAKINFDKNLLTVDHIDYSGTFISNWVEQYSDNRTGTISLVGGVPNPGYQTNVGSQGLMAVIYFKTLDGGNATIAFADTSTIYSNADNVNILASKESLVLSILLDQVIVISPSSTPLPIPPNGQCSSPTDTCAKGYSCQLTGCEGVGFPNACDPHLLCKPVIGLTPTLSLTPTPISNSPVAGLGDGNGDGKINLQDMSVLLSIFNNLKGYKSSLDLNADGIINSFDFSLMRNLLVKNGVIRG